MGGVKITSADRAFSLCVRERAGWACERCGAQYQPGTRALHCSHFHGRGKWSVRFDPDNAFAHCYGCHMHLGSRPHEFSAWVLERIGEGMYQILLERASDTKLGRIAKREKSDIAAHYRWQHRLMQEMRASGQTGRIEFVGYF